MNTKFRILTTKTFIVKYIQFIFLGLLFSSITGIHAQIIGPGNTPLHPNSLNPQMPAPPYPDFSDNTSINLFNYSRVIIPETRTTNTAYLSINQDIDKAHVTTFYMDGLGRPLQNVTRSGIASTKHLTKAYTYDENGRETYQYLPYCYSAAPSSAKFDKNQYSNLYNLYQNKYDGQHPYQQIVYDNSPLNRAMKILPPGNEWVGTNRGKTIEYNTNANIDLDHIFKFGINYYGIADIPYNTGTYSTGELFLEVTTDEDGKKAGIYKDKNGKTIAIRTYSENLSGISPSNYYQYYHITYYVYDELERLRFVISPEAYKQMIGNGNVINSTTSDGLCYKYFYDKQGRLTTRKFPDKGVEFFIYDKKDRLVAYQDNNLRQQGKWHFSIYDCLNRVNTEGLYTSNKLIGDWETVFYGSIIIIAGSLEETLLNYAQMKVHPQSLPNCEIVLYNYYDDYNLDYNQSVSQTYAFDPNYNYQLPGHPTWSDDPVPTILTKGMLTGQRIKVFSNPVKWMEKVFFYDINGRLIQEQNTKQDNLTDVITNKYDFSGDMTGSVYYHQVWGWKNGIFMSVPTTLIKSYNKLYSLGRVRGIDQKINNTNNQNIYFETYDDFGRVATKSEASFNNVYEYNIRGWLTGINPAYCYNGQTGNQGPFFGEHILYSDGFTTSVYNGNISGIRWRGYGSNSLMHAYGYTYDKQNRLTHAAFARYEQDPITSNWNWSKQNVDFTVSNISYDNNGNIKSMNQRAPGAASSPITMDDMMYEYYPNSNQLKTVTDGGYNNTNLPDFKGGAVPPDGKAFKYDGNGNLTHDSYKGINTGISYSYLNKPESIVVDGKGVITYTYDALGNTLQKKIVDQISNTTTTFDYYNQFVYKNNELQFINNEEGRARPVQTGTLTDYQYDYFIKDHLGNVRSVVTSVPDELAAGGVEYIASHEIAMANFEEAIFSNIGDVRDVSPLSTDPSDFMAAELDGNNPNRQIGTAIMLKVMAGDKFDIMVNTFYEQEIEQDNAIDGNELFNAALTTLVGGTSYAGVPVEEMPEKISIIQNAFGNGQNANVYQQMVNLNTDPAIPASHLNYLLFDEDFNLVENNSGVVQFGAVSGQWNVTETPGQIDVAQNGYLVGYVDNASTSTKTYADRFRVRFFKGQLLEENHYYPFGLTVSTNAANTLKNHYKYNTKELQRDEFTDANGNKSGLEWYDYGARMYNPQIGRWMQIDPMAETYYYTNPYGYVSNNPIAKIDPNGMEESPIYDQSGNFLGTDNEGLQGAPIIMNASNFVQNMSHQEAQKLDLGLNALKDNASIGKFSESFSNLPSRPDYDGFVTIEEGIDWAKSHPNALSKQTTENTLYLDASKLNFGGLKITDFKNGKNVITPVNLFSVQNLLLSASSETLRATVYALGRVDMILLDNDGHVQIQNNPATGYDWNRGGGIFRSGFINFERWRADVNDNHGFNTLYYGIGKLNTSQTPPALQFKE